jgi:hypothetical protein
MEDLLYRFANHYQHVRMVSSFQAHSEDVASGFFSNRYFFSSPPWLYLPPVLPIPLAPA